MKLKSVLCILFLWSLVACNAGNVQLFTGENYDAKVSVENGGIVAGREKGGGSRLDLNNILEVTITKYGGFSADTCPSGVLLVNGTFIAGDTVRLTSLDEPFLKMGSKTQYQIPMASIARIVYKGLPADKAFQPLSSRTGAILPNGDFFVGIFDGFKDKTVAINSDFFGPQRFTPNQGKNPIGALVLRDLQPSSARYVIITREGSRFLTDDPHIEGDGISLHDSILGQVKIPREELGAFRATSNRYQYLSKLKPSAVEAPPGVTDAMRIQPPSPTEAQTLLTAANASVSYTIPPGFSILLCHVAVPKEVPPTMRFSFAVYLDGKPNFRSPPIGSGDLPQPLRISLSTIGGPAKVLKLRMEPATKFVGVPFGKWIDPVLLRP